MYLTLLWDAPQVVAQDPAAALIRKVRSKLERVSDYKAEAMMKTDVDFLRLPVSQVEIYFRKPDKFRINRPGGLTLLPKSSLNLNLSRLLSGEGFIALPAGESRLGSNVVKMIRFIPEPEITDIVLAVLYIDESQLLIRKSEITTRDAGTYEMDFSYGRYQAWSLPDKVSISFNLREYTLPKGLTFEYEPSARPSADSKVPKSGKGRVEITYQNYTINKGVPEAVFK